jgi:predicted peptidase
MNRTRTCWRFVIAAIFAPLLTLAGGCTSSGGVMEAANKGAPSGTGMKIKAVTDNYGTRKYGLFVPHNYNPKRAWPVIVFLHGLGEGGSSAESNLTVGLAPAIADRAKTFPFIAVFPQTTGSWSGKDKYQKVLNTLAQVKHDYVVDADRVYLTGLSTGGYGTWVLGAQHPEVFAAIVPMCAYTAYDEVDEIAKNRMPVWCFHNSADPFVFASGSKEMCDRIRKAGGAAKYTQYGAVGHNCWDRAYRDDDLYKWMLAQKRGKS